MRHYAQTENPMCLSDAVTASELTNFARAQLRSILDRSGGVLYSGAVTLPPGPVYFGLNHGRNIDASHWVEISRRSGEWRLEAWLNGN
jgi:hypothetical protein